MKANYLYFKMKKERKKTTGWLLSNIDLLSNDRDRCKSSNRKDINTWNSTTNPSIPKVKISSQIYLYETAENQGAVLREAMIVV
jgi:hypothetical protein